MTETDTPEPPAKRRARPRYVLWGGAAVVVVATAGSLLAYGVRRELARDALVGWLEQRGVESEVEIHTFDLGVADARLRIGPAADPDVIAERVEVRYGFGGFWNDQPLGVRVASVRLTRPAVKASFKAGKLSLGSLDPLVEEFAKRPPQPDRGQPDIEVDGGQLRLTTDYGRLNAHADLRLKNGRLSALAARIAPAELAGEGLKASVGETRVLAVTTGSRLDILVSGPVRSLAAGDLTAQDLNLKLDVQAPYPDFKRQRGAGKVFARLTADGKAIALGENRLTDASLNAQFDGASVGWIETLGLFGDATATLTAAEAKTTAGDIRGLRLRATATDFGWSRKDRDLAAQVWTEASAGSVRSGDLRLADSTVRIAGPAAWREGTVSLKLNGGASGRGGWSGLGPGSRADPPETAALKRALNDFRFEAPAVGLTLAKGAMSVGLGAPVRIRTASGGEAVLTPAAGQALYRDGTGAAQLAVRGGGLPTVDLDVERYVMAAEDITASIRLKARGGLGPVMGASLETAGQVRIAGGATSFTANRCTPVSLARLEMGENDIETVAGELCPGGAPLFTFAGGAWRVRGQARGFSADVPFLEIRAEDVAGSVDLGARGEALQVQAQIRSARLEDTAAERRFNPVRASGQARLAGGVWTAGFAVADPQGRELGEARLVHNPDGRGRLDFDTGELVFAEDGLQPANLAPLAAAVGSPATGQARFTGQMSWTPEASDSAGNLDVTRLDFRSPAGEVRGLSGKVAFTSLVPLVAAPGQTLRAEQIKTLAPLADAQITFALADEILQIEGASFALGGGKLTLLPFAIPFAPGAPWNGVIEFEGVQVKDLVESSPFGDRVDLEAKLSGRVPFQVSSEGIRVTDGTLRAIEPGRLSIVRAALTDVKAEGGAVIEAPEAVAVAPDPYSSFVYQALEHLAFDQLDATLNSQEGGRLGIRFQIKGEHNPPVSQKIRLTLREIITRKITRELPLPKGTKVDLTLDTSVNQDELLKDFTDIQSVAGSQAVQPRP